jgi:hypothetical protein
MSLTVKDSANADRIIKATVVGGEQITAHVQNDSTGAEVFGTKTDAKSTATDTTAVSAMALFKQISASLQSLNASLSSAGQGAVNTATTVIQPSDAPFVVTAMDGGTSVTSVWGVAGVPFVSANATTAVNISDAPTSGQKIVIDDIILSVGADMDITIKEETSGAVIFGPWYCSAKSGPMQITLRGKRKLATANKKVQIQTSVAGTVTCTMGYHSEA